MKNINIQKQSCNLINRTKIGSIPQVEAFYEVTEVAEYFPDFIRLYQPYTPIYKLKNGLEISKGFTAPASLNKPNKNNKFKESNRERSIRRTRKKIKNYVLCNNFELFATFTFRSDRQNIEKCKSKMANWLKNESKRKGRFNYLIVPEFHKDKKSLHFHALLSGYSGKIKPSISSKGKAIIANGRRVYEFPSYKSGFTNVQKINKETKSKTSFYVIKYISKDMPLFNNKNRYWVSNNLKKPVLEYNPDKWFRYVQPSRTHFTEYGKITEYQRRDNPLIDMLGERFENEQTNT